MSRQDDEEADALALHIAAAQQQAAAAAQGGPFGIMQPGPHHGHGMHGGMPPMMGMMPPTANFFGMNHHQNAMSMNPSVAQAAAMMAQSQRQQRAQQQQQHPASAFSHAAAAFGGLPTHNNAANNSMMPPAAAALAAAQNIVNSTNKPPGVQPRLVHDAASAPRPIEPTQPKRGPGRPVGSGRNRMKQHHNHLEPMKDSLSHQGGGGASVGSGGGGKDPQTGYPYFSDSPTVTSQDSSDISVPNINMNNNSQGGGGGGNSSNSSAIVPPTVHAQVIFGSGRPEMPPPEWYASCMPLGLSDDRFYLSELQCLLRDEFVEVFGTTEVSVLVMCIYSGSILFVSRLIHF